ncbi:predicted protein [Naegleria gruberi]|uniref:Predicted protein n=1 Tax=Naegleria gruberi TaxID=5762 RepID=D2VHY1_NAEGR|nr:uncharacterized protein NAEGRDRAFT_68485 [Naegleria gruberi]EFC43495.1 predicted protein [Naegleria gruberi]|eukprot:XP_002676239.1 predicted protein [Naegleria gruberi strain NEG-M]
MNKLFNHHHHSVEFLYLFIVISLLGVTCCFGQGSIFQDNDQPDRLSMMKLYKNKLDDQLDNIRIMKQNVMALRDANDIITPYVDNLNIDKVQLQSIMDKATSDLISLIRQEQDLLMKQQIIGSSIAVLSQRRNGADLLADQTQFNYVPGTKCICFDLNSGKSCKPEEMASENLFSINETQWYDGSIVKSLTSVSNYIPTTCREYLTNFYVGKTGNGLYIVKPSAEFPAFPVYCDMSKGGWIYLNGIQNHETPFKQPITPITPDLVESIEFRSLIKLANQVKSMVGDECAISYDPDDYHERTMKKLCTVDGFSTPGKFVSFFQYFIR